MGGGLLIHPNAEVVLENVVVSGNHVTCGGGGGIANFGKLGIVNSSIDNNYTGPGTRGSYSQPIRIATQAGPGATPSYSRYGIANGGGIYNAGELYAVNSSITNNRSGNNGGGIFNEGSAALAFLNNVTLQGNEAAGIAKFIVTDAGSTTEKYRPLGVGGAVLNTNGAEIVILHSTIYQNKAYYNAGLSNGAVPTFGYPVDNRMSAGALFKIGNSIVAENTIESLSLGGTLTTPAGGEPGVAFPIADTTSNCWAMDGDSNKIKSLLNNVFDNEGPPATGRSTNDCANALSYPFGAGGSSFDSFNTTGGTPVGITGVMTDEGTSTSCRLDSAAASRARDAYQTPVARRWLSYVPATPFDQRGFVRITGAHEADLGAREEGANVPYQLST
ncbi:MAG: hypothetical protein HQM15_07615 [Deltaproteobacteria bacterium]|nr:hypothetical protein [Deltaproteobacteria bacterium]